MDEWRCPSDEGRSDVTLASEGRRCYYEIGLFGQQVLFYWVLRGEFYQQVFGLPMGASLSPILTNIFLDSIEMSSIQCFRLSFCLWGRFVDDVLCFGLLDHLFLVSLLFVSLPFKHVWPKYKIYTRAGKVKKATLFKIFSNINNNGLLFPIYKKPTHNDRYLFSFISPN